MLLRYLPCLEPDRLALVWSHPIEYPSGRVAPSKPDIEDVRALDAVSAIEGFDLERVTITISSEPELVNRATANGRATRPGRAEAAAGTGSDTRSLVLAVGGGAPGLLLAAGGVGLLKRLGPDAIPRIGEVSVDATVLAFSIGVTILVTRNRLAAA